MAERKNYSVFDPEPQPHTAVTLRPQELGDSGRIYVAIDLETTGLDMERDQIIEIGAVRFQDGQVLARFSTLVNPQRAVPLRITQITGIRTADVSEAPLLAKVLPELLAFVGSEVAAIIAHSATFDLGFLRTAGVDFHRPAYDTLELAQMLLPGQASYSLGELCQHFAIPLVDAHRALHDAEATSALFHHLWQQATALPTAVHDLLLAAAQDESGWAYRQFFADTRGRGDGLLPRRQNAFTGWRAPDGVLPEESAPAAGRAVGEGGGPVQAIPEDELLGYLRSGGPLASLLGGHFELRSGQVAMAAQVLHAFNTGDYLLIEAGTGTGKSLAYLLPAALFALANQCRVLIATNTIALQDQLVNKDIPQVQALLAARPPGSPPIAAEERERQIDGQSERQADEEVVLQAAVLKGRQNYLCTRRLHEWRTSHALSALELSVLAKVLVWLAVIGEGDAGDLVLNTPAERAVWARICSDAATCSQERCGSPSAVRRRGSVDAQANGAGLLGVRDFYWEARRQADSAHLIVVNHALLLADLMAGERVLPPYRNLIVDETHHLEEAATDQMTYRVEWPAVQLLLRRISPEGDLLNQVRRMAEGTAHALVLESLPLIAKQSVRTSKQFNGFMEQLTAFARSQTPGRGEGSYTQRLALDGSVRSQPEWSRIEVEWSSVRGGLQHLVKSIEQLVQQLQTARWWESEPSATLLSELADLHTNSAELAHQLDDILLAPGGQRRTRVAWMEGADNAAAVTLAIAPLTVNELLERELLLRRRCAIFTGATLRTGSSFRYIRDRLGLWDVKIATVDSPFDYKRSTLLFLPSDAPLPNQPHYQQMVEQAIVEAAAAAAGRTLVLFTSYQQLRATADAIRPQLDRQGISLFQHGQSSRLRLLREYRQAEQAVLLGTRSFWEGIDLPGEELTCLLIARLPFAVPNDPLVAARSAEFEDPFHEYTVPDAVLRLRQGFGRLIRRAADRGVVVLLDSRAWRKDYGSAFLEALPECTVRRAPLQNLGREVRGWLNRPK